MAESYDREVRNIKFRFRPSLTEASCRPSDTVAPFMLEKGPSHSQEPDMESPSTTEIAASVKLPQSASSPNLVRRPLHGPAQLRRTQSYYALGLLLSTSKPLTPPVSRASTETLHLRQSNLYGETLQNRRDSVTEADNAQPRREDCMSEELQVSSRDNLHLHRMDISKQLRSMSAMSQETESSFASLWHDVSMHCRILPDISGSSGCAEQTQGLNSISERAEQDAPSLGRVRSPATSSYYSRRSSVQQVDARRDGIVENPSTAPIGAADALHCQLPPSELDLSTLAVTRSTAYTAYQPIAISETPNQLTESSSNSALFTSSAKTGSTLQPGEPMPSKGSSSFLTIGSKRSRLTPTKGKRAVRKRRSIFKFLRPCSWNRNVERSVSSPVLLGASMYPQGLDGVLENPSALLAVEYEMQDHPRHSANRSASVNQLESRRRSTQDLPGAPDPQIERRTTLIEYERNLSVIGDDRRRPSTVSLRKLEDIEEDSEQRRRSIFRRKLARARPLDDEPLGLMAQALEAHQQEKALFRSESKHREATSEQGLERQGSVFRTDTLTASSSFVNPSPAGQSELLDPFDKSARRLASVRVPSASNPNLVTAGPSTPRAVSHSTAVLPLGKSATAASSPGVGTLSSRRIGTNLASWSRYPSHTRVERAGSAGRADHITTRDFARDVESPTNDKGEPTSKKAGKAKAHLPRRRSATFSGLVRYYSSMFSSNNTGAQNRRSSVATGGWLQHPDLELLPPPVIHDTALLHDRSWREYLHEVEHDLEEHLREDVAYVEDEAVKFEGHILKDVEEVEEEAEKLTHINLHYHHSPQASDDPFSAASPFAPGAHHPGLHRDSTFIDPLDESNLAGPAPVAINVSDASEDLEAGAVERNTGFDGTLEDSSSSKAESWSSIYKECLLQSESTSSGSAAAADDRARRPPLWTEIPSTSEAEKGTMGPPSLKPAKARLPEQAKSLDPDACIRRFPSVTVVDDRKGHSRSISLISVRVKSEVVRSSTDDLLELINAKEREERERLLRGPSRTSTVTKSNTSHE